MNKNDVTVNYAFQEYIPEKELNERGIKEVSKILTYEEPRWTLKDTASALKIIKEADSSLYEKIQSYIKEQHLPSENTLQLDFGKSLRYDREYMGDFSKETLSDKLDNRFIVRYSHDNDEGNLIDGGDEIIINDENIVSLFNSMIEEHVKENIQKYDEYKTQREAAQKNKEIEKDYTNFLDRKSLLADSKIVTDEMLNVLYELSEEDVNFDSLEKFTEKKYRELNTEERTELIKKLSNADYKLYKNCYISTSKLLYEKPETLVKEIKALNVLNDLGYTVYLLPFGYARNNQEFLQKSADSMLKSQFLEMKTILSTSKNAGQSAFKDSRKQSNNVILSFTEDITPHKAMQSIWNYINGAKKNLIKNNESYDFSGELFLHFEKDNKTVLYEISKEGEFIQKDVHAFGLKKTLTLNESQVVELFSDKTHPLPKFTIQSNPNSVNEQMKENLKNNLSEQIWLWKDYDDLSGHLVAPDGKSYFSYDWTTKEYKVTPDSVWDSFLDADPTRDTSLTAFKEYAQKFVKENIVKDRDIKIIFEREYIDTEKLLEEEEKRMAKSETLADKYNRMEKLFEGKMSHLGSGNGETFNELCKWVEEEFPEKDSEGVLLEATSRMLEEMFDFDEFNYQNYDDVYGFGDGAQWRFDLSESAAKKLLSGEILNYYEAQNYIWEKAKKEFAELKNNPQYKDEIEITDRINSAFRIADYLYPEFTKEIDKEKNLLADEWPQYSKEEKKNVINNAFEHLYAAFKENRVILDVYDEDRLIIVDKSIPLKDFETLIKGRDAVNFGKESLTFTRPNAEQLQTGIKNGWGLKEILTGYDVFQDRFNESGQMLPELEAEKEFVPSEYVLNKLKEKGIEVVTDKKEFNELINTSKILQKIKSDEKENISDKYFQANKSEAEAFAKELDVFVASVNSSEKPINPLKMLNVGSISPVMKVLGIADVPVQIEQSTVSKALREEPLYPNDKQGHKLTLDEIKTIPQSLADPVMVFRSDSPTRRQRDSYVFFTEHRDFKGRSVIIPVAVNKKFGRIVINKINSIYGRNEEVGYVKDNIKRGNLVYFDKKRSLEWERECKVQFLAQVLPAEGSINNILSKDSLVKFLESKTQNMVHNGTTYGFAHNGKIYLNPEVLSAEVAMHEYTHLWDNLTRKDNPELWNKGLQIFKGTSLWNEVVNDENYADIKDDENLVLSECHARITGKVAEAVLNRIAEQDGTEKQAEMIDWDKETINFIFENYRDVFAKNSFETVAEFTSATMKELFSPMEQQKRDISINSSAYERMEKLFDGKTADYLGNSSSNDFKEIYHFLKNEFPSKDALHETVSCMIYSNINFGDLEPASYDAVYDKEGVDERYNLTGEIAKMLINNEIPSDWMTIQNEVNDFASRRLMDLKENEPDMLVTDTINEAFLVSKKYNEIVEKDLNDYAKSEKIKNIQKALENIKKTYTEDSHDIRNDYGTGIFGADLETLIKGNDAVIYGEKSLDFVRPDRISLELGIEDDIPFNDLIRGYFVFDSEDLKVPRHIEHWDYMEVFDSDYDAAQQWCRETGGKLLENGKDIWISDEKLEHYCYPDTPENREALKEYLLPQPLEFNWDNFTEEQFKSVKEEITSGKIKEDYKGQVYVGSVCAEFTITDKESNWVDYNNYILGEKGEGEISGIPYSYKAGKQIVMNTFSENSYEDFKTVIKNVLMQDFGKDSHLKQEAMRQTINWATINENNKDAAIALWKEKMGVTITHSVTFPCGFTFPKEVYENDMVENKREDYRWKIYEKIKDKYGFNDNDAETEYFPGATPSESSFNISFSVSVPEEIQNNPEKVNKWIEGVENYVKEECGCTFINWQGGERNEQTFVNEKQFKMQQERNSDFAHPNAEDLEFASSRDIKDYCKLNSEIELTDEQVREIHNFYDNNDQFALYVSPAGNLYERDEYKEELISADSELLKAGNHLRTLEGKERLDYLLKNTSVDELEWSTGLLNQLSNNSDERFSIVSDVLSDSFATLDRHDNFWKVLLEYGADPTRAIRISAEDANLGDNLNWLLDNVPESQLNQIFSDNGYADAVFDIAKKSVEHDMDSWHGGEDIGFEGFKRIARLCEREVDADRYYGELLEKVFLKPVEPKIVQLLDTPELLAEKMNAQRIHQNEPEITKEQASAILDYCNYENIKFYIAKDGGIYSLDVSEDYNGEGLKESNFGIAANGIEYARKAQNLNYSCYSTVTFNMVSELWQKERQFVNPSVENTISTFTDDIDTLIENNIKEYLRREYAETYPNSGKFEVTVENQSYPINKDDLDYIANSDEWGSVEDRLNDVIDRRFEEEIEQKENDILSDVQEYIAQETNGNLILKDSELREVLFSEELVQIYAPKEDFLANQPEEVKAALVEAGIARSELYNNVDKEPLEIVKELADKKELSEVPDLFKKSFIRAINQTSSSKDPFIITKSIINKWKVSKPKYIPVLNNYLKKQNCSSKEGFEKFFNELVKSSKQKKIEKKTSKDNNFVLSR